MGNAFCHKLGIRFPVILGGMARVGTAPLAAAVSNAGGLGLLGASTWSASELKDQIRQTNELTNNVFGVNIPVRSKHADEIVSIVINEKIPVVSTSAGDPRVYTEKLKKNGIFVMHVVPTVEFAVKAEKAGVDAVIAEGVESGGRTSNDEIATFVLIPQVVDAVTCPVVAAGGIGDGRGLAAALALGAVAVQMGTIFLATEECEVSPVFKKALVLAKETDTILRRGEKGGSRVLAEKLIYETQKTLSNGRLGNEKTSKDKDASKSLTRSCGQITGLIREIRPVADLIEGMIGEANKIVPKIKENIIA